MLFRFDHSTSQEFNRVIPLVAFRFWPVLLICSTLVVRASNPGPSLLNEPVDISGDFRDFSHTYYLADRLASFEPATASGTITYQRAEYFAKQAFDNLLAR